MKKDDPFLRRLNQLKSEATGTSPEAEPPRGAQAAPPPPPPPPMPPQQQARRTVPPPPPRPPKPKANLGPTLRLVAVFMVVVVPGLALLIMQSAITAEIANFQAELVTRISGSRADDGQTARKAEPAEEAVALFKPAYSTISDSFDPAALADATPYRDRMGYVYPLGTVLTAAAVPEPVPLAQIAAPGVPLGLEAPLGKVSHLRANTGCSLRPVGAGEKLVNVLIDATERQAPVQALSSDEVLKDLTTGVSRGQNRGGVLEDIEIHRGQIGAVDVYVTDTSAPLYLLLQTDSSNRLWTIHAAPGVSIAHVAMIAGNISALAGNIGAASVEALRAEDFFPAPDRVYDTSLLDEGLCMVHPQRRPDTTWTAFEGSKSGDMLDGNLMQGKTVAFEAYAQWFRRTLGADPESNLLGANVASQVLIGPPGPGPFTLPPEAVGKPLDLAMTEGDVLFSGLPTAREAQILAHHEAILRDALGGDPRDARWPQLELGLAQGQAEPVAVKLTDRNDSPMLRVLGIEGPEMADLRAITDLQQANHARRVGFSDSFPLKALLAPGEAMPAPRLQPLYAMLRTPGAMMQQCRETLSVIARACRVTKIEHVSVEDGQVTASGWLGYVPNYAIGQIERISGGAFVSADVPDLPAGAKMSQPEARIAYLQKLTKLCDRLRAEQGSCVIDTVRFDLRRDARNAARREGGWVSVYGPNNDFEASKLKAHVAEIWADL